MEKYRNSESNIKPKLVEYLQDGILLRFDIKKVQKENGEMFEYFELNAQNIEEVVNGKGFKLTDVYKNLLK